MAEKLLNPGCRGQIRITPSEETMHPNQITVGTCYRTARNEVRSVIEITAEKRVIYKARNSFLCQRRSRMVPKHKPRARYRCLILSPTRLLERFRAIGTLPRRRRRNRRRGNQTWYGRSHAGRGSEEARARPRTALDRPAKAKRRLKQKPPLSCRTSSPPHVAATEARR